MSRVDTFDSFSGFLLHRFPLAEVQLKNLEEMTFESNLSISGLETPDEVR